jgi:aminoglycoside 6'-N-acetyltransferase
MTFRADPTTSGEIAFRRLAAEDLAELFAWLSKPHVRKWYAPAPSSYAEVVARYGPRTEPGNAVRADVVLVDGAAVGYAQTYAVGAFPEYAAALECGAGVAAMDLFIGEEARIGRGLGPRVIRRYVEEVVFADPSVRACVAGPDPGHAASIRAFEKAGFRRWKVVHPPHAPSECTLRLDRAGADPA